MFRILALLIISIAMGRCGTDEQQENRRPANGLPNASSSSTPQPFPSSSGLPIPNGSVSGGDFGGGSGSAGSGACNHQYTSNLASMINTSGNASFVSFTMQADAKINVQGTDASSSIALNASIVNFTPALARSMAQNILNGFADPLVLTFATGSERTQIFADPNWKGLECVVLPVKSIRNAAYSYEYNPPIPFVVNPNATAEQLAAIGSRNFPGINAKILKHPTARAGTYQGTASVSATGNAVKIEFDFGGAAPRANSTPMKSVQFAIDPTTKGYSDVTLSAFIADNSLINLKVTK